MPNIKLTRFVILCGCLFEGLLTGCSSRTDPDSAIARVNGTNIERLANLYFTFQSQHEWRGPADEAEFKSFLHKYNPDGSPAPLWQPWVRDGKPQLPIQEDETALVIWLLARHYERARWPNRFDDQCGVC